MPTENLAPDADSAAGGWTTDSGGGTNLFAAIDETTASDTDYIKSPTRSAAAADLIVRLKQGSTTIATWTHSAIGTSYVDAVQTLTAPQLAAITDFANLFVEFDDNAGAVYRASLANPSSALTTPVTVSYRYKGETVAAGAYTGPGDVASGWISWYGLRAFSAATAGTPCCMLKRASDNATLDINTLANGTFDIATATTFLTATTAIAITMYDQTVNTFDVGQNLGADPSGGSFVLNAINARPGLASTASYAMTSTAAVGLGSAQAQPYSIWAVAKRASGGQSGIIAYSSVQIFFPAAADSVTFYPGSGGVPTPVAATDNVFHDVSCVVNGASSITCVDGTDTTGINAATSAMPTGEQFQFPSNGTGGLVGTVLEGGFFVGALTAPQRAALSANARTYYGL